MILIYVSIFCSNIAYLRYFFFERTFLYIHSRYGLGSIYIKQEKYQLAEIHFKKALAIHPTSTVIMCIIGVVRT